MNKTTVVVGSLQTNCYILENNHEVLIIDPGDEADKIIDAINKDYKVIGIIITHHHFDHIGASLYLKKYYKIKEFNMSNLKVGNNEIGSFNFEVISTPGHYKDSITIYFKEENWMFVGDFLFKCSIGRVDLEGSSVIDMINSLKNILNYPNAYIFPGHGPSTMLDKERDNISYFIKNLENNL